MRQVAGAAGHRSHRGAAQLPARGGFRLACRGRRSEPSSATPGSSSACFWRKVASIRGSASSIASTESPRRGTNGCVSPVWSPWHTRTATPHDRDTETRRDRDALPSRDQNGRLSGPCDAWLRDGLGWTARQHAVDATRIDEVAHRLRGDDVPCRELDCFNGMTVLTDRGWGVVAVLCRAQLALRCRCRLASVIGTAGLSSTARFDLQ